MNPNVIDFNNKFSLFSDAWQPKVVAKLNDYVFKLAKIEGEFVWHKHDETDEVFIVHSGSLRIDFRTSSVELTSGQMIVIPRGVEHKPYAEARCEVILVEPEGTLNTGDVKNERTIDTPEWI